MNTIKFNISVEDANKLVDAGKSYTNKKYRHLDGIFCEVSDSKSFDGFQTISCLATDGYSACKFDISAEFETKYNKNFRILPHIRHFNVKHSQHLPIKIELQKDRVIYYAPDGRSYGYYMDPSIIPNPENIQSVVDNAIKKSDGNYNWVLMDCGLLNRCLSPFKNQILDIGIGDIETNPIVIKDSKSSTKSVILPCKRSQ